MFRGGDTSFFLLFMPLIISGFYETWGVFRDCFGGGVAF